MSRLGQTDLDSSIDVELKRSGEFGDWNTKLELLLMHKVKTRNRLDLIDCWGFNRS
jgi:hypothetical protein